MGLRSRLRRKRILIPIATVIALVVAAVILQSTSLVFSIVCGRSASNSRDFGPVPRAAIFGRVFLIYWPLDDSGRPATTRASYRRDTSSAERRLATRGRL